MLLPLALSVTLSCGTPADAPTLREVVLAKTYAGEASTTLPLIVVACEDTRPDDALAWYHGPSDTIYLLPDWRKEGGLVRLIHELAHRRQYLTGKTVNECLPTMLAARYGFRLGASPAEREDAARELRYGLMSNCDWRTD